MYKLKLLAGILLLLMGIGIAVLLFVLSLNDLMTTASILKFGTAAAVSIFHGGNFFKSKVTVDIFELR